MFLFLGLIAVAFIILYKRSTEIIVINPMRSARPAAPALRGPDEDEAPETLDFARLINTVQQAAQGKPVEIPVQGREAIRRLVRSNQFIEAMQLYRRLYGVDLKTAKKAVDELMLEQ